MPDNVFQRLAELERRVGALLLKGTVVEADYGKAVCRVKADGITTGWLHWAAFRAMMEKTWWAPRVGEQVLVLSPCGNLNEAVVLMAFYQDAATAPASSPDIRRTEFPDGTWFEYDCAKHLLRGHVAGGDAELTVDNSATLTAGGDVTLSVTGNMSIECGGEMRFKSGGDMYLDAANIKAQGGS